MKRRHFIKLLSETSALGLAGFPMIGHTIGDPQITKSSTEKSFKDTVNKIGKQVLENKDLIGAIHRVNRSVVLKAVKVVRNVPPSARSGENASSENARLFANAINTIFGELYNSGVTKAVWKIMPTYRNFPFSNPQFIQTEMHMIQEHLGYNINQANIIRLASHIEKQRNTIFGRAVTELGGIDTTYHPAQESDWCAFHDCDGGGIDAGIANTVDLLDWDRNSASENLLDIASLVFSIIGFIVSLF